MIDIITQIRSSLQFNIIYNRVIHSFNIRVLFLSGIWYKLFRCFVKSEGGG